MDNLEEELMALFDMEFPEGYTGAIMVEDPRDYKLGATTLDIPKALNTTTFEYNQLEYATKFGQNLCTLYAPIGMLSDLIGKRIENREALCQLRTDMYDFNPSVGGYLSEGVNCVRNWWNKNNPNNQIRSFALNNSEIMEAMKKGHRVNIGYMGNATYNKDAADGVLDSMNIGPTSYGHSTTVKIVGDEVVVDSYAGVKKHNIYKVADFQAFLDSPLTFATGYMYMFNSAAIDAQIALLKEKHKNSGVIFNAEKIKEYHSFFNK